MSNKIILLTLIAIIFLSDSVEASNRFRYYTRLQEENARGYLKPFADVTGKMVNSGIFNNARVHKLYGFEISVKNIYVPIPKSDKVYDYNFILVMSLYTPSSLELPDDQLLIDFNQVFPNEKAPSIFGARSSNRTIPKVPILTEALASALLDAGIPQDRLDLFLLTPEWQDLYNRAFEIATVYSNTLKAPGWNSSGIYYTFPQLSLGLPMNSEILIRYMDISEGFFADRLSLYGVGFSQYLTEYYPFSKLPIDITVAIMTQKLNWTNSLKSSHQSLSFTASRNYGRRYSLTPYAGLGIEKSRMKVEYVYVWPFNLPGDPVPVKFEIKGDTEFRITAGLLISISLLRFNIDYSQSNYRVISFGAGLSIR